MLARIDTLYLHKLSICFNKLKHWDQLFFSTFMCSPVFSKDLMLFYEDDPKPPLLTIPPSIISSTRWLSEGPADVCNLWDAGKLVKE